MISRLMLTAFSNVSKKKNGCTYFSKVLPVYWYFTLEANSLKYCVCVCVCVIYVYICACMCVCVCVCTCADACIHMQPNAQQNTQQIINTFPLHIINLQLWSIYQHSVFAVFQSGTDVHHMSKVCKSLLMDLQDNELAEDVNTLVDIYVLNLPHYKCYLFWNWLHHNANLPKKNIFNSTNSHYSLSTCWLANHDITIDL